MELKEIINYVKDNSKELKISDEAILECATQIFVSGRLSEARIGVPPRPDKDFDNKPTLKQINFLKSKNYDIPVTMTFEEAKEVIGKIIQFNPHGIKKPKVI